MPAFRFEIAGLDSRRLSDILSLRELNPDWRKPSKILSESGKSETFIYKYKNLKRPAEFVSEPNAVSIFADGTFIGYVPEKYSEVIRMVIKSGRLASVSVYFYGGDRMFIFGDGSAALSETKIQLIAVVEYLDHAPARPPAKTESAVPVRSVPAPTASQSDPVFAPPTAASVDVRSPSTIIVQQPAPQQINVNVHLGPKRNKWVAFLLCLFLGVLGAHQFYDRKVGKGILYMFTCGLLGIGWIVDLVKILLRPNPYYINPFV